MLRDIFSRLKREPEVAPPEAHGPLYPAVRDALVEVQAYARSHGGHIELIGVNEDGEVRVRFRGACKGCPVADLTFKLGIEQQLKLLVPGVRRVERVP